MSKDFGVLGLGRLDNSNAEAVRRHLAAERGLHPRSPEQSAGEGRTYHGAEPRQRRSDMVWLQTASGKAFNLLDPRAEVIRLADIAQALSRIIRFNGHGTHAWSVAAHSRLVAQLVGPRDPETKLYALLHDAPEAFMGDLISPMKAALDSVDPYFAHAWGGIEQHIARKVHVVFGLSPDMPDATAAAVKLADLQALELERRWFFPGEPPRPWRVEQMLPLGAVGWSDPPDLPRPVLAESGIEAGLFIDAVQRTINERHGLA